MGICAAFPANGYILRCIHLHPPTRVTESNRVFNFKYLPQIGGKKPRGLLHEVYCNVLALNIDAISHPPEAMCKSKYFRKLCH